MLLPLHSFDHFGWLFVSSFFCPIIAGLWWCFGAGDGGVKIIFCKAADGGEKFFLVKVGVGVKDASPSDQNLFLATV